MRRNDCNESHPFDVFERTQCTTDKSLQDELDLVNRKRTNPFQWRGQFSPELIEVLMTHFVPTDAVILDPFAGVGTTLLEAARRSHYGLAAEIHPAAVAMASTMIFTSKTANSRQHFLKQARDLLDEQITDDLPLFSPTASECDDAFLTVVQLCNTRADNPYLWNIFVNTLIRAYRTEQTNASDVIWSAFRRHSTIIEQIPHSALPCEMAHADARRLPFSADSVDVIITSPPYINVFNYHQNNRPVMELLGCNLLTVARSEIGSNRKNRGNRFLTVVQYCLDMVQALLEFQRVCKSRGRMIVVVGRESRVRGIQFHNAAIFSSLAVLCGFQLEFRQERKFQNKFGNLIYEDILHFGISISRLEPSREDTLQAAKHYLTEALNNSSEPDICNDVAAALDGADAVQSSPLLDCGRIFSS